MFSIIIPHFNTPDLLKTCVNRIRSVYAEDGVSVPYEVIVVDDCSNTAPELPSDAVLEIHDANRGYAASCNTGARRAQGDIYIFLNTDIELRSGFFKSLSGRDIDIGGLRLETPDGTRRLSCRRFPGYMNFLFNRRSILTKLFPRNRFSSRYLMTDKFFEETEWVSGAAMVISRNVFRDLNGFDERFFLYFEDVDICKRARSRGYSVVYIEDIHAVHTEGSTTSHFRRRAVQARHISMWRYYAKHIRKSVLTDIAVFPAIFLRGAVMWILGANR